MIKIEDAHDLAKRNSGPLDRQKAPLTVGQLELELLKRYPKGDAEPWDHTGLLAGDPAALVKGVAVALDPTPAAIAAAKAAEANVLLTHHPAFIEPPEAFSPAYGPASMSGMAVYAAIESGVALMNFHTALDASVEATRMYPKMLNMRFKRLLKPLESDREKGYAILCAPVDDDAPLKLAHLAARVTSVFKRQPRVWGDLTSTVDSIVIGNGSANSIIENCLASHVDCLVCGEISYHGALAASQSGLAIVEMGHDVSEFPLCALLAQAASDAGVPQEAITMVDQSANWAYPEATRI